MYHNEKLLLIDLRVHLDNSDTFVLSINLRSFVIDVIFKNLLTRKPSLSCKEETG